MTLPLPLPRWLPQGPTNTPLATGEAAASDSASLMVASASDALVMSASASDSASAMVALVSDRLAG